MKSFRSFQIFQVTQAQTFMKQGPMKLDLATRKRRVKGSDFFFQATRPQGIDFHYQEITKTAVVHNMQENKQKGEEHRLMLAFKKLLQGQTRKTISTAVN
jgi:hypothetical protein